MVRAARRRFNALGAESSNPSVFHRRRTRTHFQPAFGQPSDQLHERRDASDFYTKTQDKARSRELTVLPRTSNNLDRLNIERSSTMSLDAAVAPETLTTTLHYL